MKHIVAIDLDGCISESLPDFGFENELPDWSGFFSWCLNAKLIKGRRELVQNICGQGYTVYIVSKRSEMVRWHTETWLKHVGIPHNRLILNSEAMGGSEIKFKEGLFASGKLSDHDTFALLDDDLEVVKALLSKGHNATWI